MTLKNKKILIIVGGGIAAYKSLDLIRLLKKNNMEVKTILTKSGREFVTPLSLSTLTKSKTFENMFDSETEAEIDHIALSRWADIIIASAKDFNSIKAESFVRLFCLLFNIFGCINKQLFILDYYLNKYCSSNFFPK